MTAFLDFAVAFAQLCFVLAMTLAAVRRLRGPDVDLRARGEGLLSSCGEWWTGSGRFSS